MLKKLLGVAVSGLALSTAAGVAHADTAYNTLDASIDSTLETLNLTWDSTAQTGTSGATTLRMRIDGPALGDRGGCNINGTPHYVVLAAASANPAVAVVTNSPFRFDACSNVLPVTVQATGLGSTTVTFSVEESSSSAAPSTPVWSTVEADFLVNVTEGSTPAVGCDADPAAPAWANAILKASGLKPNDKQTGNAVSTIAQEMTQHADFAGIQKSSHPAYENAVRDRLVQLTGKANLATAQQAARPGWTCEATS